VSQKAPDCAHCSPHPKPPGDRHLAGNDWGVAIFRTTRNGVRPISGANNGATAIAFVDAVRVSPLGSILKRLPRLPHPTGPGLPGRNGIGAEDEGYTSGPENHEC